jgi:hypothetical protein
MKPPREAKLNFLAKNAIDIIAFAPTIRSASGEQRYIMGHTKKEQSRSTKLYAPYQIAID